MIKENVIVAGAGQIGSRHLQALARSQRPLKVTVIEPSAAARHTAAERVSQVLPPGSPVEFTYLGSVARLDFSEAAVIIVATTADVRPAVVSELISRVTTRSLILEKVAYQSVKVFEQQLELIEKNNIDAWINCPRRVYPFYGKLKEDLGNSEQVTLNVTGSDWGFGCNTIHYIDLLCFLTGIPACSTDYFAADGIILSGKRTGFVEFTGRAGFSNGRGQLNVNSLTMKGLPLSIEIMTPARRMIIYEAAGRVVHMNSDNGFEPLLTAEHFPFQSELTHLVVDEIITTGRCGLTSLRESLGHHALLLPLLNSHLVAVRGYHTENCPVT
ncbi:MAG: class I SAM-dependent methyltransferase [Bacteroidales bacterium]|jgi:hypothetical protein|nr:class I SAM-dependent methyltransferase [Bacteroidales bacterium]